MNKSIKYLIGIIFTGVISYNSVYFQPLDERKAASVKTIFIADAFVNDMWSSQLIPSYSSAPDLTELVNQLSQKPELAFNQNSRALGIGNIGFFKVKGEGTVAKVNENNVTLLVNNVFVEIETEFIFGNAIRDASGLIRINDFNQTSEFNSISESINQKIRDEVIPDFRLNIKVGDQVLFHGAVGLNKAHLDLQNIEVIPVILEIIQ